MRFAYGYDVGGFTQYATWRVSDSGPNAGDDPFADVPPDWVGEAIATVNLGRSGGGMGWLGWFNQTGGTFTITASQS
jgi:hypothetical protein